MFKNKLILLFSIVLILLIVPSAFAQDNETISIGSSMDTSTLADSNDLYFDSNALNDSGDGSPDNPYKNLRDGRILDNTIIHLKNGQYDFNQLNAHTNISFIGQDASKTIIKGNGGALLVNTRLGLTNVTLTNLNIFNQGDLIASNSIFTNSSSVKTGKSGDGFGGAIYCVGFTHNAYLTNCTFTNNYAGFGGAIYMSGGILEVTDCDFINNTAYNYGGAIACNSKGYGSSRVTIKRSNFIQDKSMDDAGGAIYLKSVELSASDLNISSCNATFGAALAILNSNVDLASVHICNNVAIYDGGAIYQIYGDLRITDSLLTNNHAKNGGGLFLDNSTYCLLDNVSFANNSAQLLAGAFYSLINENLTIVNVSYFNNSACEYDDLFKQENLSLIFQAGNFTLYCNVFDDALIPSRYSLIDDGYVTPVKDQKNGGNCWAFAIIASLESAILKASGENIVLSEENVKNLASLYSLYGWAMETNDGGYDGMGVGYLTSWLGPILDITDSYNDLSTLSPIFDSIMHVQNILFLKRSGYYDLDSIKKAIMNYGGVYADIHMSAYYNSQIGEYVQCYRGNNPCDHVVVLVGWDDDFYIPNAPGKGAWIAKNSWGENWGDNGYFYVSYFDNSCPKLGEEMGALAFILNDTVKYDKNYQYDVAKTDYFLNFTQTVWYKNVFKATDKEYLAAVSTYFEKNTEWELSVYVNDVLKSTKSGNSPAGYYTFNLNQYVPLDIGDVFEVIFKITVDKDAGVPISEKISLNHRFYHENISYISYDGENWRDLFNLTWEYPDHTYDSQVACIKAFTILNPINVTITLSIENRTSTAADIVANVLNQWGFPVSSGNVTFRFDNEDYTVNLTDGIAKKTINLKSGNITAEFNAIGYLPANTSAEIRNPLVNTTIALKVTGDHNPINITAEVYDLNDNPVRYGHVLFHIGDKDYMVEVSNGSAKLENIFVTLQKFNISATYIDLFYYQSSNTTESIEMPKINTKIILSIMNLTEANNPVNITAHILDLNGNPVNSGFVVFSIYDEFYQIDVLNGTASVVHTFSRIGNNVVSASYFDDYVYNSSKCNESIAVSKMKVNLTLQLITDEDSAVFGIVVKNATKDFQVLFYVDGENHTESSTRGFVIYEIKDMDYGVHTYTIKLISQIYEADDLEGEFNITYHKTQIMASDNSLYYNGDYLVILKDESGNAIPYRDIYLTLDGKTYKKRTNDQGIAIFNFALNSGQYLATIEFIGDDEYLKSLETALLDFKSTIDFTSNTYSANSKYSATLRGADGNLIINKQVNVVLNGVDYCLKTDGNGRISINVNLNPGLYDVRITNLESGEVKSQTIIVVKRITENKGVSMYYGAGKTYQVRVCDDLARFVPGLKVKFTIASKSYYYSTDNNGYASFKINLKPGTYTITAQYNGLEVSNKIAVKSTIITKNIAVKKGKIIKFTAKLLNKNGKILKNKKVTFKFKGKTYKIKTNKKGIAVLKITKKYKKGRYTIKTSYGKLTVKNKIRIK